MASGSVQLWLVQGGLEAYIDRFSGVSVENFRRLLMQVSPYDSLSLTFVCLCLSISFACLRHNEIRPADLVPLVGTPVWSRIGIACIDVDIFWWIYSHTIL